MNLFEDQLPSGKIPTLMVNAGESRQAWVDTLSITLLMIYLTQRLTDWSRYAEQVKRALTYVYSQRVHHEVEGHLLFSFNGILSGRLGRHGLGLLALVG